MTLSPMDIHKLVDTEQGLIDRRIFWDNEIYQMELEHIFARCWLLLGHESEVPNPNDFITTYMGEDPVILCRSNEGELGAFLNLCRHRGNRICRADRGNNRNFLCAYHGWTFNTAGELVTVPNLEDSYANILDPKDWGLVPVAQLDTYKGLIFATFDPDAPPLHEYLGGMAWYLDFMLDRREGGTELIGIRRWTIDCNWKVAAENFIGDGYHGRFTHASILTPGDGALSGGTIGGRSMMDLRKASYYASPGNGHGQAITEMRDEYIASEFPRVPGVNPLLDNYFKDTSAETLERLGPRARRFKTSHGTVFPNFSFQANFGSLHVWHPKGPGQIEVRDWTIVDKDASPEVKHAMLIECMTRQGPAGTWEQDDSDNWIQLTQSGMGTVSRKVLMNYQMGLGQTQQNDEMPGKRFGLVPSDHNQRVLYQRWKEHMVSESWDEIRKIEKEAN